MILAAGEGTRLRPLTLTTPKPMLAVQGKPTLEWILLWLRSYGIREAAINLSYKPEVIHAYFGEGSRFDIRLVYSLEEQIMGTAGGAKRLERFLDEPFVLVYGDVLTDLDLNALIAFHQAQPAGARVTLSLYHVPNPTECGIVRLDVGGRIQEFVEKPPAHAVFSDLANAGVLILEPEILEYIPAETYYDFSHDLFPRLLAQGIPLYGWVLPEENYLIDIGSHEKYAQVQAEWPTTKLRQWLALEGSSE